MAATRELKVQIVGDSTSAQKALNQLNRSADDVGTKVDHTRGRFDAFSGSIGKVAVAAGGLFATAKLAEFGADMVKLGTELDTFAKKSKTVFEGSFGDVTRWADENASAFGITDDKLRALAANFGDLLKPMGFTAAQAADMSTKVVGLSGALSAWSGGQRSAAEVSEILAKAMLGERDSLKELGISISQADVDARLAAKGQSELTGAALEQAKAVATQELIFEKSADAQKAWADGSLDAVKKQNSLKEKLEELKEQIATKLQPVFEAITAFVVDKLIPGLERLGEVLKPVLEDIGAVASQLFNILFKGDFTGGPFAEDSAFIDKVFAVRDAISGFVSFITEQFANLVGWTQEHWASIEEAISHVVNVIQELWSRFGDEILGIARAVWSQIQNVIETVVDVIRGVIELGLALINGDWGKAWDAVKGILSSAWDFVKETVGNALEALKQIIEVPMSAIRGAWDLAWGGISEFLSGVWTAIKNTVIEGVQTIVDMFLGAVEWIVKGAEKMFGWVPGVGGKLKEASASIEQFRDDANAALEGIKDKHIDVHLKPANFDDWKKLGGWTYKFATGGQVPGTGMGDTVPAWLTPGEFVVNKSAVNLYGPEFFEQLNARRFAGGGRVEFAPHTPHPEELVGPLRRVLDTAPAWGEVITRGLAGGGWGAIVDWLRGAGEPHTVTSTLRPGSRTASGALSLHAVGKAVDLVSGNMMRLFNRLLEIGGSLQELFYDPAGFSIKNGKRANFTVGGHRDHVHAATFDQGGILPPGLTLALNRTGHNETVIPGDVIDYDRLAHAVASAIGPITLDIDGRTVAEVTLPHTQRELQKHITRNGNPGF